MINRDYLEIIGSALTDKTGVTIRAGNQWRANVKKKILEYDRNDLERLDFDLSKGLLLHELGHIKFTEPIANTTALEKNYPEAGHDIINAFEDMRIEYQLTNELGDFAEKPLLKLNGTVTDDNITKSNGSFTDMPKLHQFLHLTLMAKETERNDYINGILGYHAGRITYDQAYNPIVKLSPEIIQKWNDNRELILDIANRTQRAGSTAELAGILDRELTPIIAEFLPEAEKNPLYRGTADADDEKKLPEGMDKTGQLRKMTKAGGHLSIPDGQKRDRSELPEIGRTIFEYGAIGRTIGQKLNDILKERRATKYTGNYTTGRLLSKNVYKILTNDNRIFSRKLENKPAGYRFYFCVDNSGSMNGEPAYYAIQTAQILQMALEPFYLPIKYYQYGEEAREIVNFDDYRADGRTTNDLPALELVRNDAKSYPTDEKIIFLLTDGYTENRPERSEIIRDLKQNHGYIFAIGIGNFDIHGLQTNYENIVKTRTPAELPAELLKLVRSIITR